MAELIPTASASSNGLKSKDDFLGRGIGEDANLMVKSGTYVGAVANAPTTDYCAYIVIKTPPYIIQFAVALNDNNVFSRSSINSGSSWGGWHRLTNL